MPNDLVSSAPREPAKARPIPARVRLAIRYMTHGYGEGDDAVPLNIVQAAAKVGMETWALRKHFDRPGTLAYLRRERRTVVELICAGNPRALERIRDRAVNSVAQVNSIKALEEINSPEAQRQLGSDRSAHMTIIIEAPRPAPAMVDVTPEPAPPPIEPPNPYRPGPPEYDEQGHLIPRFDPFKDR